MKQQIERIVDIRPVWLEESFPVGMQLEPGKLYISKTYSQSIHLCCCGCGEQVPIPLTNWNGWKDEWTLTEDGAGRVSLSPSLLQRFECKSHYIIKDNKVNFI